jgi:GTP-binding protein
MTELAKVVIIGRPNVGKSTLLNRMVRSRVAIVEPTAGVTRDRVSVPVRLDYSGGQRVIEVIDTGGVGIVDRDDLGPHVDEQIRAALLVADVILFVVDAKTGLLPLDAEVTRRLRGIDKPVLLVCNKVEGQSAEWEVDSFRALGLSGEPIPISAQNGTGVRDLYEEIAMVLPAPVGEESMPKPSLKLAVVGRRNAGKSTLINMLAREERAIVSEIPGTTRDALDVIVERDGDTFVLIDTAGVRKKKSHEDAVEFFSDARSHKAIRRADVVILLFDATKKLSSIEKRLARYITDHYKPVILAANKWDLVADGIAPIDFQEYLGAQMPGISYAPVSFLSAKTGLNVAGTFALARELRDQAERRVSTGELNRTLKRALEARTPSSKSHRVRINYATQAEKTPPTFVLFVNDNKLVGKEFMRYLENRIREELMFQEVPIRFVLRDKKTAPTGEMRGIR